MSKLSQEDLESEFPFPKIELDALADTGGQGADPEEVAKVLRTNQVLPSGRRHLDDRGLLTIIRVEGIAPGSQESMDLLVHISNWLMDQHPSLKHKVSMEIENIEADLHAPLD